MTGSRLLALVGLLLLALNLRPAITSVSPILTRIGEQVGLSSTGEGILTTLPILCLGLAAPAAPLLSRRFGPERAALMMLIVLAISLLVRPYVGWLGLFIGTAIAGGSIGALNVLLPGMVKRDFPSRVSLMTGLYTMTLNLGAATAAGATEPLRLVLGGSWQLALSLWLLPAVFAALVWLPQTRTVSRPTTRRRHAGRLMRDPLAWQVTAFMGLQSSLAYIVFGWLPTILADRGMPVVTAGLALSTSIMIQMISAVGAPWIGGYMKDQRFMNTSVLILVMVGLAGCLYAPLGSLWVWVVILGIGQGGSFSMALTMLAVRAPDAETAGELSAMAQGFGYTLAAMGPLAIGLVHDVFGNWSATGVLLGLIAVAAMIAGLGAGRDRFVASS